MKKTLISFMLLTAALCTAQRATRAPKMLPTFSSGYYINMKGDTVRGQIQNNPENQLDFHYKFAFKTGKQKARLYNPQKAKGFGYDGKDYILAVVDGEKIYLERLVTGRLRVFQYQFAGKVDGYKGVVTEYYIKDTQPEENNSELGELKRIPKKYYKKTLKPYLRDQPMIWSDLDKFTFDEKNLLMAITEFNNFYSMK